MPGAVFGTCERLLLLLLCVETQREQIFADFTGGSPPLPLSEKRVSLQFQLIIPGCDSV